VILQVCIAESLRSNGSIQELNLADNKLTQAGASDLATALTENRCLQILKLRGNPLGDDGVAAIFNALLDNSASLMSTIDCR
jgi:Ran GTPase-activating protein (RanGAP) involved in mRNA processing and transport